MIKIVHAADLHLDSPMRGLEQYTGAPVDELRGATRKALENLVRLCIDEQAGLLLIAGDLYDGDWDDYKTGLFFAKQMSRLREADVEVVWVRGNHDAESAIRKSQRLRLPDNVHELSPKKPATLRFEQLGVAVHGQGFADRRCEDDLAAGYPPRESGVVNIGLLHTSLTGREGHAEYAPTRVEVLAGKGYEYWALGHVHQQEIVAQDPWIVYPGNLQGRHARETGPKGAVVFSVEDGRIVGAPAHRALDVARWAVCEIDAGEASSGDHVVELACAALRREIDAADGRTLAARLIVRGATPAHAALRRDPEHWITNLRAAANEIGGEGAWLEKIKFDTRAAGEDLATLAARDDAIGQLLESLRALRADPTALDAFADTELAELSHRLGTLRLDDPPRFDAAALVAAVDDVEQVLLPRLLAREREEEP